MKQADLATRSMKAWHCRDYGGPNVLALEEKPTPPLRKNEILVRNYATTVSSADVRMRTLNLPRGFGLIGRLVIGISRPRQPVLGTDLAGTVEAVGTNVSAFKPGDAVIGFVGAAMGCHAEYRVLADSRPIVLKPSNLSFGEAASLPFGGLTALHFIRKAQLEAGETVLVIGASGAVGSAFVQLASHFGAHVTGLTSTRNLDLVQSLGAKAVIDYSKEDFNHAPDTYDIIVDTVGASTFRECCPKLNPQGRYISVAGSLADMLVRSSGSKRSIGGPSSERLDDLKLLAELAENGILKPVIDRTYRFEQIVEAHAYVETGRKRGSVVVSVNDTCQPIDAT